ncbi:outer membrane protein assembly factor BamB family protein [Williamsia sp. SKLECPSW1]
MRDSSVPTRARGGVAARWIVLLLAAVTLVAACADGEQDVRSIPSAGWASYGGDAGNANFAYADVPDDLALSWTRPTGGPVSAPLTISGRSNVQVTSRTESGCNTFVFDSRAGRKNWCRRMAAGVELNAILVDQYDNAYVGEAGNLVAYTGGGSIRWRFPTVGVPVSLKFAGPGVVLLVTDLGQVVLINSQTGQPAAPGVSLRSDVDASQPTFGLGDCITGGPNCAIQSSPAVDTDAKRFYLEFWPEKSIASEVRALRYDELNGSVTLRDAWTAQIPSGVIGTPTLSADKKTLYVFDRLGSIYALDAATGKTRWSYFVGGYGFGTMTVSPDGVIIPTGVIGAPLRAIRDRGDHAEPLWQRNDLQTVSLSALTKTGTAWTVVRSGKDQELSLVEVSASDGKTMRTLPMPGALGFATGVAVSASGAIATATNLGEVYFFDKPKD